MSRRGHCLDNAVAERFFHSLKTEGVKRKVYAAEVKLRQICLIILKCFTIELD
jgi:putative transposase